MDDIIKILIFGGIGFGGFTTMGVVDPETVTSALSSLNIPIEGLDSLNGYFDDMREVVRFVKEELPASLESLKQGTSE